MSNNGNTWCFCVVGNIVEKHLAEDGTNLYGTRAFVGGTKVYIYDLSFNLNKGMVSVIGLNRYRRYAVESVPICLIENVRVQRVFKPKVLQIMKSLALTDGWMWRGRTAEDKRELISFTEEWKGYLSELK